ncbi:DUF3558 domain-containing protein [Streptomyces sp. NPDC056161]|uniref:DUF3558 domain-containing protein n=1 Tax=Streptomyces sp. NPDC056161 TaxID=3345732 RepID=UPI0035DAC245
MSEGTMQRAAQRDDQPDQREGRAGRLRRALVCAAAVSAALAAAGCSSDSGSPSGDAKQSASDSSTGTGTGSASPTPTVQAAAYRTLPESCSVLSKKTLGQLVPKGSKSGKKGSSNDAASRASCSWSSLDDNGVKGSQFRWLNVSLLRFESGTGRGSADEQARAYYTKQVQDVRAVTGAKNLKSQAVSGTGDEATALRYDLKKKEGDFKQQTVVARVENVVVTLDYNGAGLAGEKTPNADDLLKSAQQAVKEAVTAVASANTGSAASPSSSPSESADKSPSPAKSASKSPSKEASPSESSAKKG